MVPRAIGVKGLTAGPDGDITLVTTGFDLMTF